MTRTAKENQEYRAYLARTLANAVEYVPGKVTPIAPVRGGVVTTGFLAR